MTRLLTKRRIINSRYFQINFESKYTRPFFLIFLRPIFLFPPPSFDGRAN